MFDRIKKRFAEWVEWQDAKAWAKQIHPAWVEIATKSQSNEARIIYKDKILSAYRGG